MAIIAVYLAIVMLVIEISVVLVEATGLERRVARFQVVSLLTGTGFTTQESELILGHPVRRRIGIFLILFGAFSLAVVISIMSSLLIRDFRLARLAAAAAVLLAALLGLRTPAAGRWLNNRMSGRFRMTFEIHELSVEEALLFSGDDAFLDIPIGPDSPLRGRTLSGLSESQGDLNVLVLKRGTVMIRDRRLDTELEAGDVLYVYGDRAAIAQAFERDIAYKKKLQEDEKQAQTPL
ncbi:TrkA C-terminal domain-containing protein [Cohnella zeiphila]|uniref:TrkA C-terminal domain-containing protein n=1 Tax=Cohnella zeiphila TaxID=2761120 RepID=A0A7X0SSN3_9BACL|nr:TrkA C-terminal domain-containing protein [Cohnella zeiphila]MBB6735410.1 TrkA C-terminal domain-containing protein [Cohnella zeiphila]